MPGTYQLQISALTFEENSDVEVEFVAFGRVFGWAGTDYLRRDLLVPLLWGMPSALAFGLTGAILTTLLGMIIAAPGVWFGGWVDGLVQRLIEVTMILPVLAVGVLIFFLYDISLWVILGVIILRRREPESERPYRAWGHPYSTMFCLAGWTAITLFQAYMERETALYAVAMVAVSWPVYWYLSRK